MANSTVDGSVVIGVDMNVKRRKQMNNEIFAAKNRILDIMQRLEESTPDTGQ